MKTSNQALLTALSLLLGIIHLHAQGTAFTYQGRLNQAGAPYSGGAEFQATLWDAASGGAQVAASNPAAVTVSVTNGLFVIPLDFGAAPFAGGANRWLQLEVRIALGPFTPLSPRQALTPTPYALNAGNLSAGTYASALTLSNAANSFSGSGAGLTALNAGELTSGTVPDARLAVNLARTNQVWLLGGNAGNTLGSHFLGTTDNQPLEFKVKGQRAWRLEPTVNDSFHSNIVNVVGGSSANFVGVGVYGATIGGGGAVNYLGNNAYLNRVEANFGTVSGGLGNMIQTTTDTSPGGTIGGGFYNTIQSNAFNATIGGGGVNTIQTNAFGGTISGGIFNTIQTSAERATIGGGEQNTIQTGSSYATIGGGYHNTIQPGADYATLGAGYFNTIQANAFEATIAGGLQNTIQINASYTTIAGGAQNMIQSYSQRATIGGGASNTIQTNAFHATIGGGTDNTIQPNADSATIPGGSGNSAASYAFAAGRRAKANHQGSFVWGDSQDADFASTADNQFNIRAAGGVRLSDSTPQLSFGATVRQMITLYDSGVNSTFGIGVQGSTFYQRCGTGSGFAWYQGGIHNNSQNNSGGGNPLMRLDSGANLFVAGTYLSGSDRNVKTNFATVSAREILDKVTALPISSWAYKQDAATKHIGPMAQDFYAAFNLGTDDKHIATVDADGVALAAIQGLNQKVEDQGNELKQKLTEIAELKTRLEKLEQFLNLKAE